MKDPFLLRVGEEDQGQRLDLYLVRAYPEHSRSAMARLIRDGRVKVNGRVPRKMGHALEPGDVVVVEFPSVESEEGPAPEDLPLHVVFEDEDFLVVDKPSGLAVHPGPGHSSGTLVNALLARVGSLSTIGGAERPGIVHRLDKETSGLLLVAKNDLAHEALARQLRERTMEKVYLALLRGRLEPRHGVIEAPIARDPDNRQRMAIVPGGRQASTGYRVLAYLDRHTLVEARPHTGRTHQIRVHFASLGHPIAGDATYGREQASPVPRLFLHARQLRLRHPRTGQPLVFDSPLAADLDAALKRLTNQDMAALLAVQDRAMVETVE